MPGVPLDWSIEPGAKTTALTRALALALSLSPTLALTLALALALALARRQDHSRLDQESAGADEPPPAVTPSRSPLAPVPQPHSPITLALPTRRSPIAP